MLLRTFVVLIVSLLIFVMFQIILFTLFDVTPDETPSVLELLILCFLMMLASFAIGTLAFVYEKPVNRSFTISFLASILATIAIISLFQEGSKWSQFALLVLFIPSLFAGQLFVRRYKLEKRKFSE